MNKNVTINKNDNINKSEAQKNQMIRRTDQTAKGIIPESLKSIGHF